MARVEIEERAWSDTKLRRLAQALGTNRGRAMGVLASLWHDSQCEGKVTATRDDLDSWLADEIAAGVPIISILEAAGYIEQRPNGDYKIDGNKHRMMKIETYKKRSKHAIESRWEKIRIGKKSKKKQPIAADTTSITSSIEKICTQVIPTAYSIRLDSKQPPDDIPALGSAGRLIQDVPLVGSCHKARAREVHREERMLPLVLNSLGVMAVEKADAAEDAGLPPTIDEHPTTAVATRSRKKNAPESKCAVPSGVSEFIGHFVETYQKRYPQKPVIDGPAAGSAKRIVKALGLERAKEFVDAFMRMDDSWFLTKRHKLPVLADNLDSVSNFIATGVQVTGMTIRAQELTNHNRSVVDQFLGRSKEA